MQFKWLSSALVLAAVAQAHNSFEVRRSHELLRRQGGAPQNAADAAKVYGIEKECQTTNNDDIYKMTQSNQIPKSGQIATLADGDDEGKKVWNEIKNSGIIPSNVKPKKGTQNHMGLDQSGQNSYDKSKDPDCWWSINKCTKPKAKGIPEDLDRCDEKSTWGLTFDDGPNCSHNEFYDFLQKEKLRATMFYIGTNIANHPYQAQRALADGHDVCVHTWSHHYMTTLSDEQVFAELYYTAKLIKTVMGVTPRCWRPPFGDTDDRVRAIAAGLGLRTILWQEDTEDWKIDSGDASPEQVKNNYKKFMDKADSESPVVLTHELTNNTMQMFVDEEPALKKAYKNIVPMTACVGVTNPYPEDITYPNFKDFTSGKIDPKNKPDITKAKVDANAKYSPVPLSKQKQKGSYANPAGADGGSSSGDKQNSSSESSSESSAIKLTGPTAFVSAVVSAVLAIAFL